MSSIEYDKIFPVYRMCRYATSIEPRIFLHRNTIHSETAAFHAANRK